MSRFASPKRCRDRLGGGGLVDAARDEIGRGIRVNGPAREMSADCREREDRCQVADDVAPVLVELVGRDHDVREGCPGRPVADRDDGRPRAGRAARSKRGVRRGRAAFVGDADHEAAAHRVERQLERLDAGERRGGQAGGPQRVAQDLDAGERPVLRRAAAGDQDRLAGRSRLARSAPASPPAGPEGAASDVSRRLATPGSASIISVMWYGGPGRSEGIPVLAHGSGGPGSGASGSKARSLMAASIRAPGDGADDDSATDTAPCPG